jgi:hypothetical protein
MAASTSRSEVARASGSTRAGLPRTKPGRRRFRGACAPPGAFRRGARAGRDRARPRAPPVSESAPIPALGRAGRARLARAKRPETPEPNLSSLGGAHGPGVQPRRSDLISGVRREVGIRQCALRGPGNRHRRAALAVTGVLRSPPVWNHRPGRLRRRGQHPRSNAPGSCLLARSRLRPSPRMPVVASHWAAKRRRCWPSGRPQMPGSGFAFPQGIPGGDASQRRLARRRVSRSPPQTGRGRATPPARVILAMSPVALAHVVVDPSRHGARMGAKDSCART